MKTIALLDTHQGGHHLTYLRLFSKTLLEMGYRVIVFWPKPEEINVWIDEHCIEKSQYFHCFQLQEFQSPTLPLIGRRLPSPLAIFAKWKHLAAVIQNAASSIGYAPDLVFFSWIDDYFSYYLIPQAVDAIFPYLWSGIYFQPRDSRKQQLLPGFYFSLKHYAAAESSRCCTIALLDEIAAKEIQRQIRNPVVTFPDITDESLPDSNYPVAKQIQDQANGRKIIGLVGSLSQRKGLLTLLKVAQQSLEKPWFFVFAGRFSEESLSPQEIAQVQQIIKSQPDNCFFHLEFIPGEPQFNALINLCDILFAAYENFPYSSNILTKAAIFSKPIVVSDGFCMSERVKAFKMGRSIPEGDVKQCREAIDDLLQKLEAIEADPNQACWDFEGYKALYSTPRLRSAFQSILDGI